MFPQVEAQAILPLVRVAIAARPVASPDCLPCDVHLPSGLVVRMEMVHQRVFLISFEVAAWPVAVNDMLAVKELLAL